MSSAGAVKSDPDKPEWIAVHDLRHTGNQFAANSCAALKDLMTRMGHDSERAATRLRWLRPAAYLPGALQRAAISLSTLSSECS